MTSIYLAPFAVVAFLMTRRGCTLLTAGLAGLLATGPGLLVAVQDDRLSFLLREAAKGAWIAWQAIAVIVAGLFFHSVVVAAAGPSAESGAEAAGETRFSYRRLFTVSFLLGPFFESTVGFGMGIVITLPMLLHLGLKPAAAVLFSLFSQMLVPWGALGVGTVVGAELAGIPLSDMGVLSAVLSGPLLLAYLLVFWLFARRQGVALRPGQMADDIAWTVALAGLLYMATRYTAVETGTMVATGVLLFLRYLRDDVRRDGVRRPVLVAAAPYALLTVTLFVTRAVPPVADVLRDLWVVQPGPDTPAFRTLHHVSFWLLVVAAVHGTARGMGTGQWAGAAGKAWQRCRIPVAVTLVYVVMAQLISASGMATALARDWSELAGRFSVLASPVFAAVAGFLTSSNIGSNAMVMPIQGAIAAQSQFDPVWMAALQNTAGSNFTMLSAARVAMGCALVGLAGRERDIYREAYLLGVAALAVMIAATLVLMP